MPNPPLGIVADIAFWQRQERARGVEDPQLEPRLPAGCAWLGSRMEENVRVLVWRAPDGAVVEQRMELRRVEVDDETRAAGLRARFRIVRKLIPVLRLPW